MTRPRTRYPVSSFGPELLELLTKGAKERVDVTFPNVQLATRFQHRLHTLRSAMHKEAHPLRELVSRARTSRIWGAALGEPEFAADHKGARKCILRVQPHDLEFQSALNAAGVAAPLEESPPGTEAAPAPEPSLLPVDPYAHFKGET